MPRWKGLPVCARDVNKMNAAVAYNRFSPLPGRAAESISESSVAREASDVIAALENTGINVFPVILGDSPGAFLSTLRKKKADAVINLCEGFKGMSKWEGAVAALLEMSSIPFTGNTEPAMVLCLDKFKCKAVLGAHGLPVPESRLFRSPDEDIPKSFKFPVIVKPNQEDASLGIDSEAVVYDRGALKERIKKVINHYNQPALVEKFIPHREFNAAVWENEKGPEMLALQEIDFSSMPADLPRICGYEAKWYEDHPLYKTTVPICPAPVRQSEYKQMGFLAVEAFKAMGCRDYARVDFRMDESGKMYILEVNPNPDVSADAGFARALKAAGIAYKDFWLKLIKRAMERREA